MGTACLKGGDRVSVFYRAWTRDFELGLNAGAHQCIERFVFDLHLMGWLDPLTEFLIGSKPVGSPQRLLDTREYRGG